jgi:HsdM-like protein
MNTTSSTIVQRVWNYCNVLRDDGISYGDYVEQLTYLLFLKMDHEGSTMLGKKSAIPFEHQALKGIGKNRCNQLQLNWISIVLKSNLKGCIVFL